MTHNADIDALFPMDTHDRLSAFLDAHEHQHVETRTLCHGLCMATAFRVIPPAMGAGGSE